MVKPQQCYAALELFFGLKIFLHPNADFELLNTENN